MNDDLPDPQLVGLRYKKRSSIFAVRMAREFEVKTLEGTMKGKAGDWLAKGVKGELWPIDARIFEQSYELDTDDSNKKPSGAA